MVWYLVDVLCQLVISGMVPGRCVMPAGRCELLLAGNIQYQLGGMLVYIID